jgi:hypothetical protein
MVIDLELILYSPKLQFLPVIKHYFILKLIVAPDGIHDPSDLGALSTGFLCCF